MHAADKQQTAASFAARLNTRKVRAAPAWGCHSVRRIAPARQKKCHSAESVKEKERETAQAKANGRRPHLPVAKNRLWPTMLHQVLHSTPRSKRADQAAGTKQSSEPLPHTPGRALAGKHAGWSDTPRGFTEARTKGAGKCSRARTDTLPGSTLKPNYSTREEKKKTAG